MFKKLKTDSDYLQGSIESAQEHLGYIHSIILNGRLEYLRKLPDDNFGNQFDWLRPWVLAYEKENRNGKAMEFWNWIHKQDMCQ